jgi:hypothetical protein
LLTRLAAAGPLAWAVLALGLVAAVLMVATEFSTVHSVRVGATTCGALDTAQQRDVCETTGLEAHAGALIVLGAFAALLAFGAGLGRSRPAAVALLAVGAVVLAIALVLDRPTLDDTQDFNAYADAVGVRGGGYTLELIAGALAVVAGAVALARSRVAARLGGRRRRRDAGEEPAADSA